jgi:serine/threonine-protein kinase
LASRESSRRFHFLKEIASGGFGSVYLAKVMHADGFSRLAAIKLLHQRWSENVEIAQRMRDEARLLGWLRHRNIVDVIDLTTIGGRVAVIMEYLEAIDFKGAITQTAESGETMPPRAALEAIAFVASALDAAYNRPPYQGEKPLRVIHRDIKPSNIMVDESGTVKVLDFGVARADFDHRESHTQELQFGSVDYMPPERLFFEPEGPLSDVYSLGATLYEILALEKLGKAKGRPEKHAQFLADRLALLPSRCELPGLSGDATIELIRSMCAYNQEDRPSAVELVQRCRALARAFDGEGLGEWAERVIPPLLKALRDAPREPNPLTDSILSEDSVSFKADDTYVESADEGGVVLRAEDSIPPHIPATDARWDLLRQAALSEMQTRGEGAAEAPFNAAPPLDAAPPVGGVDEEVEVIDETLRDDTFRDDAEVTNPGIAPPGAAAPREASPAAPRAVPSDSQATVKPPATPRVTPQTAARARPAAVTPPPAPLPPVSSMTIMPPDDRGAVVRAAPADAGPASGGPGSPAAPVRSGAPMPGMSGPPVMPAASGPIATPVAMGPSAVASSSMGPPASPASMGPSAPGPAAMPVAAASPVAPAQTAALRPAPMAAAPPPARAAPPPVRPPADVFDEPPPRPRGLLVPALVGMGIVGLLLVAAVVVAGGAFLSSRGEATAPASAVAAAPAAPVPASVSTGPVGASASAPVSVPGGLTFVSRSPDTAKITVSCDGVEATGVESVGLEATAADKCAVKVMLKDRTRLFAEVADAKTGTYTCFADGAKACTR